MTHEADAAVSPLDLHFTRLVDVAPALLWRGWTEPALLKRWFTPAPWTTVDCTIDLVPGGLFRTVMRSPEGEEHENIGCWLVLEPPSLLVWTSALGPGYRPMAQKPDGLGFFITGELRFSSEAGRTRYGARVLHADAESRDRHAAMGFQEGWGKALEQLVGVMKAEAM